MGAARDGQLPPAPDTSTVLVASFTAAELTTLRHRVVKYAVANGLHGDRLDDFALAVYEILTNAVRHGGGTGSLRLEHVDRELICQVDDEGSGFIPQALPEHPPSHGGGRGLRLARQLTDSLTITNRTPGTTVRVRTAIPAADEGDRGTTP